ncbi:NAD-dependent epimerase/dehydratase family protein [Epilithonimonas lactis]|uniref:NAD-dependent epimerase/dehydratase family protein n=1 Tax=Epilithonimonas lactis TaxID=421072 RepID=UPI00054F008F|nr:NAD(P)-dependent oxidoreductase [Epilithonimonas lactis]SEQ79264.1 Nucleoside-diphosphate-sugar epimerase [Epilithonimonas lactis]
MEKTIVKTKKRILLTGASGTVGFETLKHLMKDPTYEITVFDVKTSKSVKKLAPLRERVEIVYGDVSIATDLEKVSQNKDVAIHLAAIIPPLADINPELAYRVNVQGTENFIHALEKNSPKCHLLFSSSISVYGDRVKNPKISVHDALKPSPGDQYGETKILCEKAIQDSKLSWTIFRLAAIMGNHKISKLMFHMPLDTPMEICTPQDTGRAFANAIAFEGQLRNRIFNLGGGEACVISYRSFLMRMFDAFGLGDADFPEKAFAEKNFHCGIMSDGDELESIIHFRRQNLEDHFELVKKAVHPLQKKMTILFRTPIKRWLLAQSEPYKAYRTGNVDEIEYFFNKIEKKKLEPTYH